jgi:hypothetical protein
MDVFDKILTVIAAFVSSRIPPVMSILAAGLLYEPSKKKDNLPLLCCSWVKLS